MECSRRTLRLKMYLAGVCSKNSHKYQKYKNRKKVFICLAADYGNLGDVAITYAQKEFLVKLFPSYEVIEYPISKTFSEIKALKECLSEEDIITFVGGGNTSERYDDIEYCREYLMQQLKGYRMISFPQSNELAIASKGFIQSLKRTYLAEKRLLYFARDKYSYVEMKKWLPSLNCVLAPDIVFSLKFPARTSAGQYILILFRHDKEKSMSDEQEKSILDVAGRFSQVRIDDTVLSLPYEKNRLREYLDDLIEAIRNSALVITDRLHGMILSYVCHTPCIVYGNANGKIQGVYEMIKKSDMVKLMNYESNLQNEIASLYGMCGYNPIFSFKKMEEVIKREMEVWDYSI